MHKLMNLGRRRSTFLNLPSNTPYLIFGLSKVEVFISVLMSDVELAVLNSILDLDIELLLDGLLKLEYMQEIFTAINFNKDQLYRYFAMLEHQNVYD